MSKETKVQDAIDNKLLESRKVFLWGQVDDKSAKHVIDRLLYLDALETADIALKGNNCHFIVLPHTDSMMFLMTNDDSIFRIHNIIQELNI